MHRSGFRAAKKWYAVWVELQFVFILTLTAHGFWVPNQQRLENFDRRGPEAPTREQTDVVPRVQQIVPGVRVDFDPILASPSFIASPRGFLTGSNGLGRAVTSRFFDAIPAGDPDRTIKAFLNEHASLFGHGAEVFTTARRKREFVTPHNGLRTVIWEQELEGIPVFQGLLVAHTTHRGELVSISSRFVADVRKAADAGMPRRLQILASPPITAEEAIARGAVSVGEEMNSSEAKSRGVSNEQRLLYQTPVLLGDTEVRRVWLPVSRNSLRLCWEVVLTSRKRSEMFRLLVDAETGEILIRHGLTEYYSDATYRVFTSDSPSPFSPGCSTPCTTQPPLVARDLITLSALASNDSPAGWISDGQNTTVGNNVDSHLDKNADDIPDTGSRPTGSPSRVFDCTMDLAQQPVTYTNATVVQLFYWCNWMHDKLYELGFTEATGNFQADNFGRGGLGNDAVQADAQDGSGFNNANFSTPPDGSAGRMQMFLFNSPTPNRDGDFDADVVLHEYTHGLSNRRVGGGVGISALQSAGMGEGWSDFYALSLLSQAGDDPNANYAAGGYVTYQLSGMTQNYYFGIRRYPYSTDMTKNPLTFKDIDPAQASAHTGIPRSPIVGTTANEVHNMGEVWCVTLWGARANLINKYGWAVGNQLILQLVTDGMNLSPANPNFLQARDAIIQADIVDTGGANRNELWSAFAKRGMGASATSPASSTTTGLVEAYDLPDFLSVTPPAGLNSSGPIGGPFAPSAQIYTLSNTGSVSLNWSASKNAAWLNLSSTSGTLGVGNSNSVVVSINPAANNLGLSNYSDTVTFSNLASGFIQTRAVTLAVTPPRLYHFPLDSDPGWSRQGEWAFGKPAGLGGTSHGYHDPTSGATGTNVFGINLNGDYSTSIGGPYYLTVGPLNFVGYTGTKLQFQRWLNTDYPSYVYATIEVSGDGTTWTQIFSNSSGVEISDTAWSKYQYDISAVADNRTNVYVRWGHRVGSGGAFAYSGWNIDDVEFFATPSRSLKVQIPAAATEGNGVLMGNIIVTPAPSNNLSIALNSSDSSEVIVPANVIVLAGQTNATFDLPIVDDAVLDGDQSATVSATATGYLVASATIVVHDNETATLTVSAPANATEGQGVLVHAGTVSASGPVAADVTVNLTSSDTTEAIVLSTVTISNGQNSAAFDITIVDDNQIDDPQSAVITAHVPNWTDGNTAITVLDNENKNLTVSLPASAYEGDGVLTGVAHVSISGTLPSDFVVSLQSSDTTELVAPATATISAGQTSAAFSVTIVDDAIQDGTQTAVVTASASGFADGTADIVVKDNDASQFAFSNIASSQAAGTPFALSVSALDINGSTIAVYQGPVNLSAAGDGGPAVIGPTSLTTWTNGVWSGAVHVNTPDTNVRLTADDGSGHTGLSNPFNVQIGLLDHFGWSGVSSPQRQDVPFPVTISAQDAGNNVITDFTGTVALSGWIGTGSGSKLVITEMYVGTPDAIEIVNVSGTDIDISGWQVLIYDFDSGTSPLSPLTIPPGTICHAGDIVVVEEFGTSPGTYPHFYTGANIDWTEIAACGVLLRDAASNVVDFVAASALNPSAISNPVAIVPNHWQGNQVTAVPSESTTYQRFGNSDTNTSNDWRQAAANIGTVNSGLTVPFGGGMSTVQISPTNSDPFFAGTWSGNLRVLEPVTNVWLVAADGTGHSGTSTPFAVEAFVDLAVTMIDTPDPILAGDSLTYSITATNKGPDKAVQVVLSDPLPTSLTFVSATCSQGTCTQIAGTVTCSLGMLTNAASATIVVQTTVGGILSNTVTAFSSATDSNLADNVATTTTTVQGVGVLGVATGTNVCQVVAGISSAGQAFGTVTAGITYLYAASGMIARDTFGCYSDPDGKIVSGSCSSQSNSPAGFICPGLKSWSLVAKINGSSCLQLGTSGSFVAPASGNLVLYFNDDGFSDNNGSWNACVTTPSDLVSTGPGGGPFNPANQTYVLTNSGSAALAWSAAMSNDWISLSAVSGTLAVGESTNITATINSNANGLGVGVYSNTLTFINLTNGNGTSTRSATLTVIAPASLAVTPANGLSSTGSQGGPFSPSSQMYTLSNTGSMSLNWSASKSASWVTLSTASGSLAPGSNTAVTVSINANANGLSSGGYNDIVTFTNTINAAGSTTRSVNLTVNAIGLLSVVPATGLVSTGTVGGPFTPSSQTYTLSNTGSASLDWSVGNSPSWVSLSATNGTLAPGINTNVTLTVNSNANSLVAGVYSNAATFNNLTSGNGTTARSVTLTVTVPGALGVVSGTNICHTVSGTASAGQAFGTVTAGITYLYAASGMIARDTFGCYSDPDGKIVSGSCSSQSNSPAGFICPGLKSWSLVAKINGSSCLQLGTSGSFVAPASGNLVLYFNDDGFSDNNGSWNACVTTPSDLVSTGLAGGPFNPANQTYVLTNSGSAALAWSAAMSNDWISLSSTTGTLAAGSQVNIAVTINSNANNLAAGVYSNTATFANLTTGNGTTTRTLILTVVAPPSLMVTPAIGLSPAGPQGGPFTPSNQVYTLSNTGSSSLNWRATKSVSWLTLSATNGLLNAGSNTTVTASINSNANSLLPSVYADNLIFTNTTNQIGTTNRLISLTVLSSWQLWQLGYFGCTNCPQAASTADPDGDGQDNQTEFLAGNNPTNNASYWRISASPTNGPPPLSVGFTENSTGSSITNRQWDFGDGGTGSGTNSSHTYTNAGTFSVGLTIFNVDGSTTLVASNLITVFPVATIDVTAADLVDESGNLMPTSGVAVLVVDTGTNGFVDPKPNFPLSLGATWGTDDKIVGLWDFTGGYDFSGGQLGILFGETVVTYANGISAGQKLQLYWFPSLTLASNTLGTAYYGKYTDTNSPPLDGSDPWQTPADGTAVSLWFVTASEGGSNPDAAGRAMFLTSIPLTAFEIWQIQYFGGTNSTAAAASADPDGDGMNNYAEFLSGTNPTSNDSELRITDIRKESNDVRVTWSVVGGHGYVLQSTKKAAVASYTTNFVDDSPTIVVPGIGESTTNYLDIGAAYAPVLPLPSGPNAGTGTPSTVESSAQYTRGLVDSLGRALPIGSLLMLGTFNISESTIVSNFNTGNISIIMAAFTPYTNSFAIGNGTGEPASWSISRSAAGFGGKKIYLLAVDAPTIEKANHLGIFTAPSWIFPNDGNTTTIDLQEVTDFVIGAHAGPLTIGLPLGQTYTFDDTARLNVLPGRILFYRVRLVP